ncbi:hypothetical protein RB199_14260 [Streptomyces libani]
MTDLLQQPLRALTCDVEVAPAVPRPRLERCPAASGAHVGAERQLVVHEEPPGGHARCPDDAEELLNSLHFQVGFVAACEHADLADAAGAPIRWASARASPEVAALWWISP